MANCGWTRLTYLLFALTILIAIAQEGGPSADPRPLATKTPGGATAEESAPVAEGGPSQTARTVQPRGSAHTATVGHDGGDDRSVAIVGGARGAAGPDPRVFYRPVLGSPPPGGEPAPDPACADLGVFPSDRRIAFPLPRKYLGSYENTWGAPRPQGGHEGTDLMAPTGTAAYAVTDGSIVAVAGANENGWNSLGGYAVMLKAAYSVGPIKQGDLFYYAHLNHESALEIGTRVSVGQTVGYVGDTGQGPEVTRGLFPPHLHLGWYGASSALTSGAMNPYPLLEWIKANGGAITGGSDARYCEAPRTGGPVPSTGESRWPAPESPGVTPDLATGANGPVPAGPEREIGHPGGAAPAQQREPAPDQSPPETPGGAAPKTAPQAAEPSAAQPPSPEAPDPPASHAEPPPDSSAPGDEPPEASDGESAEDRADAPTSGADPEGDEANDPPGEEQSLDEDAQGEDGGDGLDTPEEPGEEPEGEGSEEDSQPPGEQTSPGEDQYAPETDGEGDPETTAAR